MTANGRIILVAHGAGEGSAANEHVRRVARDVAARLGVEVGVAFRLGHPTLGDALDRRHGASTVVLPLMTSDGYFARRQMAALGGPSVRVLPAIGAALTVQRALVRRLVHCVRREGEPGSMGLIVVGHGTARDSRSAAAAESVAALVRTVLPQLEVRTAFLDQEPSLERTVGAIDRDVVVVAPFLIGGGGHALRDVPDRVRTARGRERRRVVVTPPFGQLVDLARHAAGILAAPCAPWVRLGTRSSRLAIWQALRAADALEVAGARVCITPMSTVGDREAGRPIEDFADVSPFADDLERAVAAGVIDAAVHSLKDLAIEPGARLMTGALLPRGATGEVLVSRGGCTLGRLPRGALVGTSSARRTAQLLWKRPDLRVRPIRGVVEARVAQVDDGRYDATILAEAGLDRLGLAGRIDERFDDLLPAAGQGAIAIRIRADDASLRRLCARCDHRPTRRAVEAELTVTRLIERDPALVCAALASAARGVSLRARAMSRDGRRVAEAECSGGDPRRVGRQVAALLRFRLRRERVA